MLLPLWPISGYEQDGTGLGTGRDEHNEQRTTELVNPIIEHLLGTRAWNQGFLFLNSSIFTYLEGNHLHFSGENREALKGCIMNQLCTAREGLWSQRCPSAKSVYFLIRVCSKLSCSKTSLKANIKWSFEKCMNASVGRACPLLPKRWLLGWYSIDSSNKWFY